MKIKLFLSFTYIFILYIIISSIGSIFSTKCFKNLTTVAIVFCIQKFRFWFKFLHNCQLPLYMLHCKVPLIFLNIIYIFMLIITRLKFAWEIVLRPRHRLCRFITVLINVWTEYGEHMTCDLLHFILISFYCCFKSFSFIWAQISTDKQRAVFFSFATSSSQYDLILIISFVVFF